MKTLILLLAIIQIFPAASFAEDLHETVVNKVSETINSEVKSGEFSNHQKAITNEAAKASGASPSVARTQGPIAEKGVSGKGVAAKTAAAKVAVREKHEPKKPQQIPVASPTPRH